MSRMNELSIAIDELRNAAAALNSVADSLTQLFSSEEPAKEEPAPKPITKEEVRAELAAKSAAGYGVQVRALLKRYGAAQLSAVNPDDYADLLLETQANYVMCHIENSVTSTELADILLNRYNVLIKNLASKEGLNKGNYVRLSVKSDEENDYIVNALMEIFNN